MTRPVHVLILLVCIAVITAALLLKVDDAGVYIFGWKWPMKCSFHKSFGINCASCGLTRAICYAAHGKLSDAFRMNTAWPVVAAVILIEIVYNISALAVWPRKLPARIILLHWGILVAAGVIVICNWLIYLAGLLF